MNQPLYGVWLGDVFFCFSGEVSEPKVDAWSRVVRTLRMPDGTRPFAKASLRLAELRYPAKTLGSTSKRRPERKTLGGRTMEGLALTPGDAFQWLITMDAAYFQSQGLAVGEEIEYWVQVSRFALELLLQGKFAPGTAEVPSVGRRRTTMQTIKAVWKPQLSAEDTARFLQLAANIPPIAIGTPAALAGREPATRDEAGAVVLYSFLCSIIDSQAREVVREVEDKLRAYLTNYRRGQSPLADLWWNSLLTASRDIPVQGTAEEVGDLEESVERVGGTGFPYVSAEDQPPGEGTLGLGLRLEPPLDGNRTDWKVSFWVTGREDEGLLMSARSIWSHPDSDQMIRGRMYSSIQLQLLMRLGEAATLAPELAEGLHGPAPEDVTLTLEQLPTFMKESVPKLTANGIVVQMPSRWSKEGRRRVGLSLKMMQDARWTGPSNPLPVLGMEHLVHFQISAAMGGQTLSREELKYLAEQNLPYVQFRGEWVEVDLKEINQVLRFMKRHEKGEMELSEWMHLSADMDGERLWKGLFIEEVETTGLLSSLLAGEKERKLPPRPVPSTLHGELRPYQERGYQWLSMMLELGFGVCLADDMGLGKTVQVITTLLERLSHEPAGNPVLIICPTSLLGNWQRELQRFAPDLTLHVHHGVRRLRGGFPACGCWPSCRADHISSGGKR